MCCFQISPYGPDRVLGDAQSLCRGAELHTGGEHNHWLLFRELPECLGELFTFSDVRELSTQGMLFHSSIDHWRTPYEVCAAVKHISAVIFRGWGRGVQLNFFVIKYLLPGKN